MFGNRKRIKNLEVKVEVLEKLAVTLTQERRRLQAAVSEITEELEKRKPKRDSKGRFVSKKK